MSYDIDLVDNGEVAESFNITYNVSGMFYSYKSKDGIRFLDGKSVEDSFDFLLGLHQYLVSNRDKMIDMEPENGWGGWKNTVKCINKMIMKAAEYPDAVWEVC